MTKFAGHGEERCWYETVVSFIRQRAPEDVTLEAVLQCTEPLTNVLLCEKEEIELDDGALQADFANRRIGGDVLGLGCAQEEIRFVLSPECLVSVLVCDPMDDKEAILVVSNDPRSRFGFRVYCLRRRTCT